MTDALDRLDLSFIVPVMNEAATVRELASRIETNLESLGPKPVSYEILFVDDGSTDDTWNVISGLAKEPDSKVRAIRFRTNFGKASALDAGFRHARGSVVFTLDGDLQDDPAEIPRFLAKIEEGYDVVSGWKTDRQDPLSKTLPSRFFNWVTRNYSGVPLHDFNCGFKAYRREVTQAVRIYGDLHRYIPVLADDLGFRVAEVPVRHNKREFGKSKYGWTRLVSGFLDLLTVITITRFLRKPAHLFGGIGIALGFVGLAILGYLSVLWFGGVRPIGNRPLFFLGILCMILAANLVSFGLLAEMVNRRLSPHKNDYLVAQKLGFDDFE